MRYARDALSSLSDARMPGRNARRMGVQLKGTERLARRDARWCAAISLPGPLVASLILCARPASPRKQRWLLARGGRRGTHTCVVEATEVHRGRSPCERNSAQACDFGQLRAARVGCVEGEDGHDVARQPARLVDLGVDRVQRDLGDVPSISSILYGRLWLVPVSKGACDATLWDVPPPGEGMDERRDPGEWDL